jgi:hypothetical protein
MAIRVYTNRLQNGGQSSAISCSEGKAFLRCIVGNGEGIQSFIEVTVSDDSAFSRETIQRIIQEGYVEIARREKLGGPRDNTAYENIQVNGGSFSLLMHELEPSTPQAAAEILCDAINKVAERGTLRRL